MTAVLEGGHEWKCFSQNKDTACSNALVKEHQMHSFERLFMLFMVFHMLFTNMDYVSFIHISVNRAGTPREGNVLGEIFLFFCFSFCFFLFLLFCFSVFLYLLQEDY